MNLFVEKTNWICLSMRWAAWEAQNVWEFSNVAQRRTQFGGLWSGHWFQSIFVSYNLPLFECWKTSSMSVFCCCCSCIFFRARSSTTINLRVHILRYPSAAYSGLVIQLEKINLAVLFCRLLRNSLSKLCLYRMPFFLLLLKEWTCMVAANLIELTVGSVDTMGKVDWVCQSVVPAKHFGSQIITASIYKINISLLSNFIHRRWKAWLTYIFLGN